MKTMGWLTALAAFGCLTASGARGQCFVTETGKLSAADDAPQDQFGTAVATDGRRVLVGAVGDDDGGADSGSAYVFEFNGLAWSEREKLRAPDAAAGDQFGHAVAIADDLLVVGARSDDSPALDAGSAYVYRLAAGSWRFETKITASDSAAGDNFGTAVGLSGTTIVVGAPGDDDAGNGAGAAYVFAFNGTTWVEVAKLIGSDTHGGDGFGRSVSISGDRVVVGAWLEPSVAPGAGAAYVFRFNGTIWQEEDKLVAGDAAEGDNFGSAVAISGSTMVVGAWLEDAMGANAGAAYVFRHTGGGWVEEVKLMAPDGAAGDSFGSAVGVSGELVLVGAEDDDDGGASSGSAYVFRYAEGVWSAAAKIRASDGATSDSLGTAVGLGDKLAVLGAPEQDDGGSNSGAAYVVGGLGDCNQNAVLDLCDIDSGTSADCNHNGAPDECDLLDGTSDDVNGNAIPDECELDCDGDGLPDAWEIAQGLETDCNTNTIPDVCDVRNGTSEDCDGDEFPDECEVLGLYLRESPALGPIGAGTPQSFTLADPPQAGGDVVLTFEVVGDFGALAEWLDVSINSTYVGRVFGAGGSDCPAQPNQEALTVAAELYNTALGGGDAVIHMVASAQVDPDLCAGGTYVSVNVQYQAVGPDDCNANGVPDLCDVLAGTSPDLNGNGIPDECEVLPGDVNCDGIVGFADINAFVLLLTNPVAWHAQYPTCPAGNGDVNQNSVVGFDDINPFVALLAGGP